MLRNSSLRAKLVRAASRSAVPAGARGIVGTSLPPSYEKFPPGPRPEGVPDTWQANHIDSHCGFFEDDVFPPALPGETLEEYCRRVPNIWSPCSRTTDVVDVRVSISLEWANDVQQEDHQFHERPLVKIPPLDSDWHDANDMEIELANPPDPYTAMGTVPAEIHPEEAEEVMRIIQEGAQRVGYGHWFEADNFADFWVELTGKRIEEMPFDKTMQRLLELNPGMTLLDIEKRFIPSIGKDEWWLGGNPNMTEEHAKNVRIAAKEVDEKEAVVKAAQAELDEIYDEFIGAVEEARLAGKLPELDKALAAITVDDPDDDEGRRMLRADATREQFRAFGNEMRRLMNTEIAPKRFREMLSDHTPDPAFQRFKETKQVGN